MATGAAVFHGAYLGRGAEVRVHATVHLRTRLEPGATVPVGWVAVGDPARILPADKHDEIWTVQAPLNFPTWVSCRTFLSAVTQAAPSTATPPPLLAAPVGVAVDLNVGVPDVASLVGGNVRVVVDAA